MRSFDGLSDDRLEAVSACDLIDSWLVHTPASVFFLRTSKSNKLFGCSRGDYTGDYVVNVATLLSYEFSRGEADWGGTFAALAVAW